MEGIMKEKKYNADYLSDVIAVENYNYDELRNKLYELDPKSKKLIKKINRCIYLNNYKNADSRALWFSLAGVLLNGAGIIGLAFLSGIFSLPLAAFGIGMIPLLACALTIITVGAWPVLANTYVKNYYSDKIDALEAELVQIIENNKENLTEHKIVKYILMQNNTEAETTDKIPAKTEKINSVQNNISTNSKEEIMKAYKQRNKISVETNKEIDEK